MLVKGEPEGGKLASFKKVCHRLATITLSIYFMMIIMVIMISLATKGFSNSINLYNQAFTYSWLLQNKFTLPPSTSPISHSAPIPYPTMHHFVTEWCIVGYLFNPLWNLCDGPFSRSTNTLSMSFISGCRETFDPRYGIQGLGGRQVRTYMCARTYHQRQGMVASTSHRYPTL